MNEEPLEIVAWVGEDEFGGPVGIKQAQVPAGMIPLAAMSYDQPKLAADYVVKQLQLQANLYGKTIRLVRFRMVAEEIILHPNRG
jgi:hypothetical protein